MTKAIEQARSKLSARMSEAMPLLEEWVRENSYSAEVDHVNRMGELLARAFELPELSLTRIAGNEVGDHLVWTTPAWDEGGAGVMLLGHHDTVFPPGSFDVWSVEGDIARGPGVLDMKGGLVTVRSALAALSDAGLLARIPIAVVSVGDEEIGSADSRPHIEKLAERASVALVFEAGRAEDRIITQRKGTGAMTVRAVGKGAHAGNHHADGINAIVGLSRFIVEAAGLTDYERGVTVNVGLVEGGEARNTVAPSAKCVIDFRFITADVGREVEQAFRDLAKRIEETTAVKFEVEGGIRRLPLERTDGSVALMREYAACAQQVGLGSDEADLLGGGSDANTVSAVGVPAIDGLGPRGRGFHTYDEFIEVSSLALRADALVRFLVRRIER